MRAQRTKNLVPKFLWNPMEPIVFAVVILAGLSKTGSNSSRRKLGA
jgi:hypothetical protein